MIVCDSARENSTICWQAPLIWEKCAQNRKVKYTAAPLFLGYAVSNRKIVLLVSATGYMIALLISAFLVYYTKRLRLDYSRPRLCRNGTWLLASSMNSLHFFALSIENSCSVSFTTWYLNELVAESWSITYDASFTQPWSRWMAILGMLKQVSSSSHLMLLETCLHVRTFWGRWERNDANSVAEQMSLIFMMKCEFGLQLNPTQEDTIRSAWVI